MGGEEGEGEEGKGEGGGGGRGGVKEGEKGEGAVRCVEESRSVIDESGGVSAGDGAGEARTRHKRHDLFFPPPPKPHRAMEARISLVQHARINKR